MTTTTGTRIATTNVVLLLLSSDVDGGVGVVVTGDVVVAGDVVVTGDDVVVVAGDDVVAALPPMETISYGCVRTCTSLEIKASSSLSKRMSLIGSVVVTVMSK
jgi:hypothetical protein